MTEEDYVQSPLNYQFQFHIRTRLRVRIKEWVNLYSHRQTLFDSSQWHKCRPKAVVAIIHINIKITFNNNCLTDQFGTCDLYWLLELNLIETLVARGRLSQRADIREKLQVVRRQSPVWINDEKQSDKTRIWGNTHSGSKRKTPRD